MSTLQIPTAKAFVPLLEPNRYKGAHGGRGSGKSHFFAELLVDDALRIGGLRAVCIREVQKSLKDSAKKLIEDKIQALGVGHLFEVQTDIIKTPNGGQILFQGMQDHTAESIKSLEGMDRAWVEEAQTLSARSLEMLRPTIRKEGSEIWFSWNPRRKTDPIDQMLRGAKRDNATVIEANWNDNPWFPKVLEDERRDDLRHKSDRYDHIWEGAYATAFEGAYFSTHLGLAKKEKRIVDNLAADPLMKTFAFCDIGGASAKADAFTIWICQFINSNIHVLDYYESVGQTLDYHVNWMRKSGWENAHVWLPHDGVKADPLAGKKYEDHWRDAGFQVSVEPNQGAGAAMQRVEAVRRVFNRCYFNTEKTEDGREALGFYHERKDEARNIGLGPEHDWSSHGADAFGLLAIKYDSLAKRRATKPLVMPNYGAV